MGVKHTVTWTCDRCGTSRDFVDSPQPQPQPDDWAALEEINPPRASTEKLERLGVLCFDCRSDLREWMDDPAKAAS
jgi:hypothetical protein